MIWTAEGLGLGILGGAAFRHSLWKPLALSLGVAAVAGLVAEATRRLRGGGDAGAAEPEMGDPLAGSA